jgi:hypothetical protein
MCHLLRHHCLGQEDARQAVPDVQEPIPQYLLVQVVPDQQPEFVPTVPEPD